MIEGYEKSFKNPTFSTRKISFTLLIIIVAIGYISYNKRTVEENQVVNALSHNEIIIENLKKDTTENSLDTVNNENIDNQRSLKSRRLLIHLNLI